MPGVLLEQVEQDPLEGSRVRAVPPLTGLAYLVEAVGLDDGPASRALGVRVGQASLAYQGVAAAVAQGYPHRFTLDALARCPRASLGGEFHALIVDNGFDLEVLDREALKLAELTPPLDYLNARILQCHDLWHLVAGYRTTGLHEVAITGASRFYAQLTDALTPGR